MRLEETQGFIKEMGAQMKNVYNANSSIPVELGVIQGDMSLKLDSSPAPRPKGSYMVSTLLTNSHGWTVQGGTHDGHTSGNGSHNHVIKNNPLSPGDRVACIHAGNEAVVIAIVVSS